MAQENDTVMDDVKAELTNLKTSEVIAFLKKRIPLGLHCLMCGSLEINFIGSQEQLFAFSMPVFVSDREDDRRLASIALAECEHCGFIHTFSPTMIIDGMNAITEGKHDNE